MPRLKMCPLCEIGSFSKQNVRGAIFPWKNPEGTIVDKVLDGDVFAEKCSHCGEIMLNGYQVNELQKILDS
jgi:hypothetical protein